MGRRVIVAIFFVAAVAACQREPAPPPDQPDNPLLKGLTPPPLNKPIHQPSEQQKAAPVQLPPGPASALVVMRDGRPFVGVANLTGRVTIDASRIRIEPIEGSALELLYRLPAGVPALRTATGNGVVAVVERSDPAGADQLALVRLESRPVLGEIWQTSPRPLQLDLGNGVRLVQQPVRGLVAGYGEAQLDVFDGGRLLVRVPLGRPTAIQAVSGRYVVFAEVSHLFTPSAADADQVEGGYILRAWILSAD